MDYKQLRTTSFHFSMEHPLLPLELSFYCLMSENAWKFVSSIALVLVWLFRATPALAEIGDLFVHATKLGSVPSVPAFPGTK